MMWVPPPAKVRLGIEGLLMTRADLVLRVCPQRSVVLRPSASSMMPRLSSMRSRCKLFATVLSLSASSRR